MSFIFIFLSASDNSRYHRSQLEQVATVRELRVVSNISTPLWHMNPHLFFSWFQAVSESDNRN
jgi:hypothetical protein